MRIWQKIIIGIMGIVTLLVAGVTIYGLKVYKDTNSTFDNIVEKVDRDSTKRETAVNMDATDPFSILLLGLDTGAMGRTEQGRSDTMIVVTVNPTKKQTTMLSLDRDIYTKIVGYQGDTMDKLNHAYAYGGVEMAMDSVENLLDIPLDHYVTINMQGLSDLIDAVGGIKVHNQYHFELDGVELQADTDYTLDGEKGLAYARFRKYDEATGMGDPDGDIGRQKRQREVIEKVINKVMSLDTVTNYQKILKAVEKNTKTDLTWNDMLDVANGYQSALKNVESLQLQGEGQLYNEIYYQFLSASSLLETQNTLKEQLGLATSDTLPTGDQYTSGYGDYMFYNEDTGYMDYYDSSASTTDGYSTYSDDTGTGDYNGDYDANYNQDYSQGAGYTEDYSQDQGTQDYNQGYSEGYNGGY
ncbi:LCP family protein [Enterococcus sp. 2201sp1_2201st1_B8_2201SCRN_220225]|uniref:LCP family glycopolymer transferase n=1 Tax=unclassified Enterococcus TaxID=2608891 RepID=UPI0034A5B4CB